MTRDEILYFVQEIYLGPKNNDIITSLLEELYETLPHSAISDLIYHNPQELTPEQVVDEAIRRDVEYN